MKKLKRIAISKSFIENNRNICYTIHTYKKKRLREALLVTEFIKKIESIKLPPHVTRDLGLNENWKKKVDEEFIGKVVNTAEKYRNVLKELSKY